MATVISGNGQLAIPKSDTLRFGQYSALRIREDPVSRVREWSKIMTEYNAELIGIETAAKEFARLRRALEDSEKARRELEQSLREDLRTLLAERDAWKAEAERIIPNTAPKQTPATHSNGIAAVESRLAEVYRALDRETTRADLLQRKFTNVLDAAVQGIAEDRFY